MSLQWTYERFRPKEEKRGVTVSFTRILLVRVSFLSICALRPILFMHLDILSTLTSCFPSTGLRWWRFKGGNSRLCLQQGVHGPMGRRLCAPMPLMTVVLRCWGGDTEEGVPWSLGEDLDEAFWERMHLNFDELYRTDKKVPGSKVRVMWRRL